MTHTNDKYWKILYTKLNFFVVLIRNKNKMIKQKQYLELEVLGHALRSPVGVDTDELELHILLE